MDLYRIISELVAERNRLSRIIESLESIPDEKTARPPKKRGRKSMDGAARQEVSERMKRYWAKRRKEADQAKKDSREVA